MRIGLIAVYDEMAEIAKKVAETFGYLELIAQVAVLDKALYYAREMVSNGVEVLISRGGTAWELRNAVEVPVVNCEITTYDVFMALYKAKESGRKIGLLVRNRDIETSVFSHVLNIEIMKFKFSERYEIVSCLQSAYKAGVDTIVGGILAVQAAKELGLPSILIKTHEDTVRQVLQKAVEIAKVQRKEKAQIKQFQAIVQYVNTGIISINPEGAITVFNPVAERTFGYKAADVVGRPLREVFKEFDFSWDRMNSSRFGELQTVSGVNILTNWVPLRLEDGVIGTVITFHEVSRLQKFEQKVRRELYAKGLVAKWNFDDIIGRSKVIKQCKDQARMFASFDSTVLIYGETGTGKELFAQSIHNASPRSQGPFVAINCSALPENLLESELFGYEEGAFTGAKKGGKPGLFELAHGGTIFLDEIGAISKNLQARLLRVIQEREVMRIGGDRIIPLDVRIIAATNQDLRDEVESRGFREDLYYRLNVLRINIPRLAERKDDIPLLFQHFTRTMAQKLGKNCIELSQEQMKKIMQYDWPGNVRELENFAENYTVLSEKPSQVELLFRQFSQKTDRRSSVNSQKNPKKNTLKPKIESIELEYIENILRTTSSRAEAARLLGISLSTLYRRIQKLNNRKKNQN